MGNETLNAFTFVETMLGPKRCSRGEYAYRQTFPDSERKDRNLDRAQSA
jgi:hypothetical protein